MKPIASADEVNSEWLAGVLSRVAGFPQSELVGIEKEVSRPFGSVVVRITAEYAKATPLSTPSYFFLKIDNGQMWKEAGHREVVFYNTIAPAMPDAPCPQCFEAVWDPDSGAYHLLLEDATRTHYIVEREAPATEAETEQMLAALAKLHAHWWGQSQTYELVDQDLLNDQSANDLGPFVDFMGDRLPAQRRWVYETILTRLPAVLRQRLSRAESLTLVHDDAHTWNFLLPRDPAGKVFLIDWQQWGVSLGTHDVAYHLTLFWYAERRQALEQTLVKHYHRCLQSYGVRGYDWETCWRDYRLYAIRNLLVPLWAFQYGHWAPHRWTQMEKAFMAFDDLRCAELLPD